MILPWMAYAALCAALFGLAAAAVDGIAASWRRSRRGVWVAGMCASIVVPLVLPLMSAGRTSPALTSPGAAAINGQTVATHSSTNVDVVVLTVWGTASLVFALLLLVAHRRTMAALRRCRSGRIGGREAFISQDFGPAVVGVLRHRIVVPAWTLVLDEAEQRLVVAHELEHARSGDPLLALAGVCAVVAMPWNAALWWQLSRLRLAIELDCDARVIDRRRNDALAYTRLLLSVGERSRGARHPVLAMSRSRSALAKRFDALLRHDAVQPRRVVGLVVLSVGMLASVAFVPAPSVSELTRFVRPVRQAEAVVPTPLPAGSVERATVAKAKPAEVIEQRAPRTAVARRRATAPLIGLNALPPVNVVPATAGRRPLDSLVVVRAATLPPPSRPAGGVIMAAPSGARGRAGFGAARPTVVGGDSTRGAARGGGRAGLVARPDTIRPPQ
jgi:beta-lactamase regulating signal transducer with metallopeptidase domain